MLCTYVKSGSQVPEVFHVPLQSALCGCRRRFEFVQVTEKSTVCVCMEGGGYGARL
jgi:hypothetical protein